MGSSFNDGKDDGAMRTIGEVANAIGVKAHVLRYWEQQFPMLNPLKRSGGRRYYRSEDIELVERIHCLVNDDGYTLKGARKVLENSSSGKGKVQQEARISASYSPSLSENDHIPNDSRKGDSLPHQSGGDSSFGGYPESISTSVDEKISAQRESDEPSLGSSSGPSQKEIVSRLKVIRSNLQEAADA